ncbi:response regulator transcription factor [Streptomyces sp. NBC_01304]|uniref:response regulator transcription factor n=1 Tax=Streptomyces sp. NBC_01304 TaxID=2903818 RepID=UPI002E15E907|nr:response regulator transcription factor [Streptomyces sp. NBC_01304]
MTSDAIRVLVADDHTILRHALCDSLRREADIDVVAAAGDGRAAVELALQYRPDVAILDVEMPGQTVLTTVAQLNEGSPHTRTIILTMYDAPDLVQACLDQGVSGFLHKSAARGTLLSAIRATRGGDQQVTMSVSRQSLQAAPVKPLGPGALSAREVEVLGHVAAARSNRQIAKAMGIAEGTVKRHLRNIFDKLQAVSRIDAVNKAAASAILPSAAAHSSDPEYTA